MSIADAITNAQNKVANCYTSVNNKGGTLPDVQNLSNLPTAIESIPSGGSVEYNGLGAKYDKVPGLIPSIDIPSGAFEDYTVNYESSLGAFGKKGYNYLTGKYSNGIYYNGIQNWFCNITDDGIVTGWDRRNDTEYKTVFLKDAFPSSISQLKIIIKAKMSTKQTNHAPLFAINESPERYIGLKSGTNFAMYASGWSTGTTTITKDTWYWYCVTFDGTTNTGYVLQDNDYTLDTLPELTQWSQEWTNTSDIWSSHKFIFGVNPFYSNEVLNSDSEIDLKNTLIEINNETFYSWELTSPTVTTAPGILKSGLTDIGNATNYNLYYTGTYELDTGKQENHFGGVVEVPEHTVEVPWRPKFTINGLVNYEPPYGFTNFSTNGYIEADCKLSITTDQWASGVVIAIHFKTPARDNYYSSSRVILSSDKEGAYSSNLGYFIVQMYSTSLGFYMYNSGKVFEFIKYNLTPDTEYYARLVNPTSGDTYLEISTDGISWETVATKSVTFKNFTAYRNLKVGISADTTPTYPCLDGTIYSRGTYIEIGGVEVWNMDSIPIDV